MTKHFPPIKFKVRDTIFSYIPNNSIIADGTLEDFSTLTLSGKYLDEVYTNRLASLFVNF